MVPFRLNYLIPAYYSAKPDNDHFQEYNPNDKKTISSTEVKLQISGKALLADFSSINAAIYGAYTQQSYWQAYQASAYFRETNYQPEIFLSFLSDKHLFGWTLIDAELGFVHQSNGMGGERERSWNRAYLRQIIQKGNFQIETVESLRIKDTKDYNPDIVKFLGNDSLTIGYRTGKFLWSLELRNQISSTLQRGAEIFSLSLPLSKRLNGFIEVFSGYGQCLGEYTQRISSCAGLIQ